MQALPSGPFGFAATALLTSTFCGRQSLDARGREVASAWEREGPYEALAAAEALGADEAEPRLARAAAASIAARFADEVAAPTVFILIGGLVGAALCRALTLAGRACREARDDTAFARAVAGAGGLDDRARRAARRAVAGRRRVDRRPGVRRHRRRGAAPDRARARPACSLRSARPGATIPAMSARALALFRRAAAAELAALAAAGARRRRFGLIRRNATVTNGDERVEGRGRARCRARPTENAHERKDPYPRRRRRRRPGRRAAVAHAGAPAGKEACYGVSHQRP